MVRIDDALYCLEARVLTQMMEVMPEMTLSLTG